MAENEKSANELGPCNAFHEVISWWKDKPLSTFCAAPVEQLDISIKTPLQVRGNGQVWPAKTAQECETVAIGQLEFREVKAGTSSKASFVCEPARTNDPPVSRFDVVKDCPADGKACSKPKVIPKPLKPGG